jgi:hypothetical protein
VRHEEAHGIPGTCGAWKGGLSGLGWTTPFPIQLKKPASNNWPNSYESASKCMENLGLLGPLFQLPLTRLPLPWIPLLKKSIPIHIIDKKIISLTTIHDNLLMGINDTLSTRRLDPDRGCLINPSPFV